MKEAAFAAPTPRRGVRNPIGGGVRIRAVLFDVDGTLYAQGPVRSLMALELLTLPLSGPLLAIKRLRALNAFRKAQEELRDAPGTTSIADAQTAAAAAASRLPISDVQRLVNEWMATRPLKYLRLFRARGIEPLLALLARAGVSAGVFSDYPADAKLRSLGLEGRFSPVICSTDPEIGAFKPDPRGFLKACEAWNLAPSEVLMVGDRADVDAAGAAAAGMPCVIIGSGSTDTRGGSAHLQLPSLERLHRVLEGD